MATIERKIANAEKMCGPIWSCIDEVERACFQRVLKQLQDARVGVQHFAPSTGYGYDDIGRDTLEKVYAGVMGCESALVRPQIVSGTHALAVALFGLLAPGKRLLSAVGKPYDTLEKVIGIGGQYDGSLAAWGVAYDQAELTSE